MLLLMREIHWLSVLIEFDRISAVICISQQVAIMAGNYTEDSRVLRVSN